MFEINDGTFVASEGTLPAATVLAHHNDGPVPDPPLHPMPFHANFDAPIYDGVRAVALGAAAPEVRGSSSTSGSARSPMSGSMSCCRAARFDLTQDYGGIVAASVVCELVGLPVDLAADVLATVNAGSLAKPGSGVEVANARPGYPRIPDPLVAAQARRGRRRALPIVDGLLGYRLPDGSAFSDAEAAVADARRVHRRHRDRAEDRRARTVGALPPSRPTGRGARRSRRERAASPARR